MLYLCSGLCALPPCFTRIPPPEMLPQALLQSVMARLDVSFLCAAAAACKAFQRPQPSPLPLKVTGASGRSPRHSSFGPGDGFFATGAVQYPAPNTGMFSPKPQQPSGPPAVLLGKANSGAFQTTQSEEPGCAYVQITEVESSNAGMPVPFGCAYVQITEVESSNAGMPVPFGVGGGFSSKPGGESCRNGREKTVKHLRTPSDDHGLAEKREAMMVVSILIATLTYQASLNPPGGFWPDDKTAPEAPAGKTHVSGTAINRDVPGFQGFLIANTMLTRSSRPPVQYDTVAPILKKSKGEVLVNGTYFAKPSTFEGWGQRHWGPHHGVTYGIITEVLPSRANEVERESSISLGLPVDGRRSSQDVEVQSLLSYGELEGKFIPDLLPVQKTRFLSRLLRRRSKKKVKQLGRQSEDHGLVEKP
ncbi:hypothetical protein EJ110_NYTH50668 [Nymphaea thermarum]|nr:hypothetical protein EJ110_NYTH50668 [Nymphaea thermarum]